MDFFLLDSLTTNKNNLPNEMQIWDRNWPSFAVSIACILLASGIVTNERSYIFAILIIFISIKNQTFNFSFWRKLLISLTLAMIVFGTVKGYFRGNDPQHIGRFAIPLTAFFVFCLFPGIGFIIYRSRYFIMSVIFIVTFTFYYVVKSGEFEIADDIMAGWTLTYSTNAAVSVWHYFALPFCVTVFFDKMFYNRSHISIYYVGISLMTIFMLWLLTDTSSFLLAIFVVLLAVILPYKLTSILIWPIILFISILMLDFLTVKDISGWLVGQLQILGVNDSGDLLRLIQLEYFVDRAEMLGSGFGARHDFPFIVNDARLTSQIIYPYASELPILNIIFNGGAFSAIWFLMFIYLMFYHIKERARSYGTKRGIHVFAMGCSGVFIGSMSNPYLFAPASMLLLAIIFDLADLSAEAIRVSPFREP
jgi:hypothetical protein